MRRKSGPQESAEQTDEQEQREPAAAMSSPPEAKDNELES